MISFGITNALGSFLFGRISKHIGRVNCLLLAAILNYSGIYLMLSRELIPEADNNVMLFGMPAVWGLADAAWQTQINSLYGILFPTNQEAAFSNFRLWESLGFAISYAYSTMICTSTKLYLLAVYLTIGLFGYLVVEWMENKRMGVNGPQYNLKTSSLFFAVIILSLIYLF